MSTSERGQNSGPRIGKVLKDDLSNLNFHDLNKEYRDLKRFYINEEQKKRSERMSRIKRFLYEALWILKSMFIRLTPLRRILILIGVIFLLSGRTIEVNAEQTVTNNQGIIGGIIILFVLMLELKDKLLAKDELEAGRKLQQSLLPEQNPSIPGWSIWLFTRSANEVGGDLVDFLKFKNQNYGIVLADVAGKGLKAALLMAKLQATIRALAPDYENLSAFGSKLHEIFHRDTLPGLFASMIYLDLIPDNGQMRFINAGHLPPVLINSEGVSELMKGEPALGLMESFNYTERSLELNHGDIFIAYSDGVSEAQNDKEELFGTERLLEFLPKLKNLNAEEMGRAIVDEVDYFAGNAPASDDVSLVILKRL